MRWFLSDPYLSLLKFPWQRKDRRKCLEGGDQRDFDLLVIAKKGYWKAFQRIEAKKKLMLFWNDSGIRWTHPNPNVFFSSASPIRLLAYFGGRTFLSFQSHRLAGRAAALTRARRWGISFAHGLENAKKPLACKSDILSYSWTWSSFFLSLSSCCCCRHNGIPPSANLVFAIWVSMVWSGRRIVVT